MFKWLDIALDCDIKEAEFWEMTIAELERLVKSKTRVERRKSQERAAFDYILADMIGRSVARIHSSTATLPPIGEIYPSLFEEEKKAQQEQQELKKAELSALRFKLFTQSYNKRYKEVASRE